MGCGCGSNKESTNVKQQTIVTRVKQSIKTAWAKAQPEQPTHVVKRINKKTN